MLEGNCLLEQRATPAPGGCAIFQLHVGCTAQSPQRSRICHMSRRPTGAQQSQSATSSHIGVIFVVRAPHADADLKLMQDPMKPRDQIKHGTSQDWFIARCRLQPSFYSPGTCRSMVAYPVRWLCLTRRPNSMPLRGVALGFILIPVFSNEVCVGRRWCGTKGRKWIRYIKESTMKHVVSG